MAQNLSNFGKGSIDISSFVNELKSLKQLVKEAQSGERDLDDVNEELQKSYENVSKKVGELKKQYAELEKEMANFDKEKGIQSSLEQLSKEINIITSSLSKLRSDVASTNAHLQDMEDGFNGINKAAKESKGISSWFDSDKEALQAVGVSLDQLKEKFLDIKTTKESDGSSTTTYNDGLNNTIKVYERLTKDGKQYKATLESINQEHKNMTSSAKYIESVEDALKRVGLNAEEVEDITSTIGGDTSSSWNVARQSIAANSDAVYELRNNLDKVVTVTQKNVNGTTQFSASLKNVTKNAKEASKEAGTWGYSWKRAWQSFLTYMSVTDIFYRVVHGIKDMIEEVEALDSALTELQKVTTLEGESLDKFVESAYEAGEAVAKTGTEIVEAATEFAKAGYNEDQILELGTIASMYTNIADEEISAADAAEILISQMKAFDIEATNAEHIIDAINEVSNNFAVSSSDIANNLGKSSAVMANAGNSMEQMIGLLTAGTEITRSATKVANGLKTITLRLQGMNDEGEEDLELVSKMEELYKKLGVTVYNSDGSLKNTYELLEQLASVYPELTTAEKAYVTETIAGKYQAQNAAAILNNWQTAVDATATAMDSAGSASEENAKVLDSIEGHLQRLSSSWEKFSQQMINSNLIKMFIDLGNAVLEVANSGFGQWIIKTGIASTAMLGLSNGINKVYTTLKLLSNGFTLNTTKMLANYLANTKLIKGDQQFILKELSKKGAIDKNTKTINKETLATIQARLATSNLSKAEQKEIISKLTASTTNGVLTGSTLTLKAAVDALTASIAANPLGAILVAATALISIITSVANAIQESNEEREAALEQLNEETTQAYKDEASQIEESIDKYKSLKESLEAYNITESEALQIKDELLTLQDDLIETYGGESDSLDLVNGKYEDQLELLEKIRKEKASTYLIENSSNIATAPSTVTHTTNMGGSNEIGVTGENEKFIDSLLAKGTWEFDINDSRTYAEWFYNQILDEINRINTEYNKALKNGDKEAAGELKDQLDELTTYSQDFKEQAEKSVATVEAANEAYINSNEVLYDAYQNLLNGEIDGSSLSKAYDELEDMQDEGQISSNMANYVYEYLRNLYHNNWEKIEEQNEQAAEDALDEFQKSAKGRIASDKGSVADILFGDWDNLTDKTKDFYNQMKDLAMGANLDEEAIKALIEETDWLTESNGEVTDSFGNTLFTIEDLLDYFNAAGRVVEGTTYDLETLKEAIDSVQSAYDTVSSAVDEYNQNGYISIDTLQSLLDLDGEYLDILFDENGQLTLNEQAFQNLVIAKLENLAVTKSSELLDYAKTLSEEGNQLNTEAGAVDNLTNALKGLNDEKTKQIILSELGNDTSGFTEEEMKALETRIKATSNVIKTIYKEISTIQKNGLQKTSKTKTDTSSSTQKEWWETALSDLKDQFNYNEITIDTYISGLESLLSKVDKGTEAYRKINEELGKQKLNKIKDDYSAGTISVSQYIEKLKELIKTYKVGTEAWNDIAALIKKGELEALKDQQDSYNNVLSAVNQTLEKQIDLYDKEKDAADEAFEKQIEDLQEIQEALEDNASDYEKAQKAVSDYLNEQLDTLNSQKDDVESYYDNVIDSLSEMNDEQEKAVELAEAYESLMNAMTEKTKKVWVEGVGWVWQADQDAISEAKKTYEDLVKSSTQEDIEKQKEATLASLEEQIASLENYIATWDEALDKFDNEQNKNLADILLGDDWENLVVALDPASVNNFADAYYDLQVQLESTSKKIEEVEKAKEESDNYYDEKIEDLKEYKQLWSDISTDYEENQDKLLAAETLGADWESQILNRRLDTLTAFKNKYNSLMGEIDSFDSMSDADSVNYTSPNTPAFANGGTVDFTGLAMLHGSPNRPEYVLNNDQMSNLLNNLTKPNISSAFGNIGGGIINNYNFGNIELPNVSNAQQFINELKSLVNTSKNQ